MSYKYYANEIPLAKTFIRNYLIFRCNYLGNQNYNEEFNYYNCGDNFIHNLRVNTFFVFINHCNKTTFEESYKQYLYELEYYAPDQKCVSATIFKRLLAKERRILKLVRGLKKDGNSFLKVNETREIIRLITAAENSESFP